MNIAGTELRDGKRRITGRGVGVSREQVGVHRKLKAVQETRVGGAVCANGAACVKDRTTTE
jgi:hypothetical protein